MSRIAYVNGRYTPLADAQVHVEDRGFQFADGVYEYWSVLSGRLADAEGHLDRLDRSLSELRISSADAPRLFDHSFTRDHTSEPSNRGIRLSTDHPRGCAPRPSFSAAGNQA